MAVSRLTRDVRRFQLHDPRDQQPGTDEHDREPRYRREHMRNADHRKRGQTRQSESIERDPPRTPLAQEVRHGRERRRHDEHRRDPERRAIDEMHADGQRGEDEPELSRCVPLLMHSRMVRNRGPGRAPATRPPGAVLSRRPTPAGRLGNACSAPAPARATPAAPSRCPSGDCRVPRCDARPSRW